MDFDDRIRRLAEASIGADSMRDRSLSEPNGEDVEPIDIEAVCAMLREALCSSRVQAGTQLEGDDVAVRAAAAAHDARFRASLRQGHVAEAGGENHWKNHLVPFEDLPSNQRERLIQTARLIIQSAASQTDLVQPIVAAPRHTRGVIRPMPQFLAIERTPPQSGATRLENLRLDLNEQIPDMGDEAWAEFQRKFSASMCSAYPETEPVLVALAAYLDHPRSHLALVEGSDAGIRQIFHVFLGPGRTLLLPVPTYGMYRVYAEMYGAHITEIAHETDFSLDADRVLRALIQGRPTLLAIAQPNGALGSVLEDDALEAILVTAEELGTVVLLDEAHVDFYRDAWSERLEEFDHLILLRTLSKAGGLAGLRFGYLISKPWLVQLITRARPVVEINAASALAARILFEHPEWIKRAVKATLAGKEWLAKQLEARWPVRRGHGNFVQVQFGAPAATVYGRLLSAGIRVREQTGSELLEGWLRITCGPIPFMERAWRAIESESSSCSPMDQG